MENINIVKATHKDVEAVLKLADNYYHQSHAFKAMTYDREWVRKQVLAALNDPDHTILLYKGLFGTKGGIWFMVKHQIFTTDLIGADCFNYVMPEFRGNGIGAELTKAAEVIMKSQGAKFLIMGANSGIKEGSHADELYSNLGYFTLGKSFVKTTT